MSLLIPLGLLGLLGIVALIIIYIIKPNYQQKYITSTYVWQLAKKYRKKKIPLNRLRDILLIVCQILIVTACALILAKPALITGVKSEKPEIVAVIDSSASMLTESDEKQTRFNRAVEAAKKLVSDTLKADGTVTVIVANESPYYLLQNVGADGSLEADQTLTELQSKNCGYGVANIDGAMKMCEEVLSINPETQIYLYTDNNYYNIPEGIILKRDEVLGDKEWNASILNAYVEKIDNYYNLTVEVACFSEQPRDLNVKAVITGANVVMDSDEPKEITLTDDIACKDSATYRILWQSVVTDSVNDNELGDEYVRTHLLYDEMDGGEDDRFFNFDKISITVSAGSKDSFSADDSFEIYGGKKQKIKIQYYSRLDNKPYQNPFIRATLFAIQSRYADDWLISIDEVKDGDPAVEGYDYYIFEHAMPATMPTDGFVFLIHPDKAPQGADFTAANGDSTLPGGEDGAYLSYGDDGDGSAILKNITPSNIYVKQYVRVSNYDSSYKCLMSTVDGYPAMLFKDEPTSKVAVITFSLHYSTLPLKLEFPLLMDNVFNYVFKRTIDKNVYEVNEKVQLDCMGDSLTVKGSEEPIEFTSFPNEYQVKVIGTYTVTQTTVFGKETVDTFFVRINDKELNIFAVYDELADPFGSRVSVDYHKDLLLYLAIALVAILFIEWILKITDNA